jgi:nucleoside-diphosphate-sugar epimerase
MKVLVAGSTSVIGRQLVPLLGHVGHEVVALCHNPDATTPGIDGARVLAIDSRGEAAVRRIRDAQVDAVVSMVDPAAGCLPPDQGEPELAALNELCLRNTRLLFESAAQGGATRFISRSVAYAYEPDNDAAGEDEPFFISPGPAFRAMLKTVTNLEEATRRSAGTTLRVGHVYGPGSCYAREGSVARDVLGRRLPLVRRGASTYSFIHAYDVATAVVAALDKRAPGAYNVVDDTPTEVTEWLPAMASMLQAPPPRTVPAWVARRAAGEWGVVFMTKLRGADNCRARFELDWRPRFSSWKAGFEDALV